MEDYGFLIIVLSVGALLGWLSKRLGFSEVIGYILGGLIIGYLFHYRGADYSVYLPYLESLKQIGIILLFFSAGITVGYECLKRNLLLNLASIIPSYLIIWGFISLFSIAMNMEHSLRTFIILVAINSSSATIISVLRKSRNGVQQTVTLLTSLEDIIQFVVFSILLAFIPSGFIPSRVVPMVLRLISLYVILLLIAKVISILTMKSKIVIDKEGFFFISLISALGLSFISTLFGLPPLLGAFIAGLVLSSLPGSERISDMISGVREIGLVVYFTLIGSDMVLLLSLIELGKIVFLGILTGIVITIIRGAGIFTGQLLTGKSITEAFLISGFLLPISENGLILTSELIHQGYLPSEFKVIITLAVMTSLVLGGLLTHRIETIVDKVVIRIPSSLFRFLDSISRAYLYNIEAASLIINTIAKYTLAMILINTISTEAIRLLGSISICLQIIIGAGTIIMLFSLLVLSYRTLLRMASQKIASMNTKSTLGIRVAMPVIIGGLTLLLQVQIAIDTINSIYEYPKEVFRYVFPGVLIALVIITGVEIIRIIKQNQRERGLISPSHKEQTP